MMELSDHSILSHLGGLENNSLISILDINNNELEVIKHSSYYDLDKFKNLVNEKKNMISILSLNIQSIYAKFDELDIDYILRLILSIYNYRDMNA